MSNAKLSRHPTAAQSGGGWSVLLGAMNFDKPLRLDTPEIRANVALKLLLGIQNDSSLRSTPENGSMPERAAMFQVPLGGKEREGRQRLPGLKG
ncbi:MAG: hypothetical protein ACKO5F_02500 [Synechococcus sp.]